MTRECGQKFGTLFDIKVLNDPIRLIYDMYKLDAGKILDLGAGRDKPFYNSIKNKVKQGKYYTLDNDKSGDFDFKKVEEINDNIKFDLVFANQFFEHLTIDDSFDLMDKLTNNLNKDALFFATVPNIAHPNRWMSDFTHITFWNIQSLYTLFRFAKMEVIGVYRYSKVHPKSRIDNFIAKKIGKIYRMDWCDSVLIVGKK